MGSPLAERSCRRAVRCKDQETRVGSEGYGIRLTTWALRSSRAVGYRISASSGAMPRSCQTPPSTHGCLSMLKGAIVLDGLNATTSLSPAPPVDKATTKNNGEHKDTGSSDSRRCESQGCCSPVQDDLLPAPRALPICSLTLAVQPPRRSD